MELDSFTRQYIETALWSSNDESTPAGGEPMDKNYSFKDLAPETLEIMKADCDKFQADNHNLLEDCSRDERKTAGHDFWLTRNSHGSGFWDGDWGDKGDALTAASKKFKEVNLYIGDDGKIYQG